MSHKPIRRCARWGLHRRGAFTLIELLVTITIIAALIGIGIPSFRAARNAAKRTTTSATMKTLAEGLEQFKQDNDKQFTRTNGYPPSAKAEDPATEGTQDIYGAHWLVRYLAGKDFKGYIPRRIVPDSLQHPGNATEGQVEWYDDKKNGDIDRIEAYIDSTRLKWVPTDDIPGTRPTNSDLFPAKGTNDIDEVPVFIDSFGWPILYYASDKFGKALTVRDTGDLYDGTKRGYFTHQDNEGFTGRGSGAGDRGWRFRGRFDHPIGLFGPADFLNLHDEAYEESWAAYIEHHELHERETRAEEEQLMNRIGIEPYNKDTYLLISAGADAIYGTGDDVNNFK